MIRNRPPALARGARAHRVFDQRLAQRPDGAWNAVRAGDDGVEGLHDPVAVLVGDDERREQLDRVAAVARRPGRGSCGP